MEVFKSVEEVRSTSRQELTRHLVTVIVKAKNLTYCIGLSKALLLKLYKIELLIKRTGADKCMKQGNLKGID